MIASKAARCIHAAEGRSLIDFSLRRTQGTDAGMKVARSTYLAGFDATSNVLAGMAYDIPVAGTMAHSYVMAFDHEAEAFTAYAESFPAGSVFLIDTYDTLEGAKHAARVALQMKARGEKLVGVRLDSGDMVALSRKVRDILDSAGLHEVKIFASSDLDEFQIDTLLSKGAKIDAFGVGTKIGVSADAPYLNIVYKLVRFKNRNVRKTSPDKISLAGEKQIFRRLDSSGNLLEDIIGLSDETLPDAVPLLEKVMENGRCLAAFPSLQTIRERFSRNFARLDDRYKVIHQRVNYPVKISPPLKTLQKHS
jgi:nicotinate phosphoribosyltransferase